MAKIVLFKTPGAFPLLQPTVVEFADASAGMLGLRTTVRVADGETNVVPKEHCVEFDGDLMNEVNTLVHRATEALEAARTLLDLKATPVQAETSSGAPATVFH